MTAPRFWYTHPYDRETWIAEVPGGALVRVFEFTGHPDAMTAGMAFVPGATFESFGIEPEPGWRWDDEAHDWRCSMCLRWRTHGDHKSDCPLASPPRVEPTVPVVRTSESAFGFIRTTMGDVPMCGCAFRGGPSGKIVRCMQPQLHDGPHSHIEYDPNPPSEAEIAAALGEEPPT